MKVHVLLGAPGSGKGTAAKQMLEAFSLTHLSTGDILRDAVSKGTEVGLRAKAYMAEGRLVDDDTVNGLVLARLQNVTGDMLFDGYPRTLSQARTLRDILSEKGMELGLVIDIDVPQSVLEARVVGRRVCENSACGAIYHLQTKAPKSAGVCDLCGNSLHQRTDDSVQAFRSRMEEFNRTFQPVLEFYKGSPNYRVVDGNRSPLAVFESLQQLF